MKEIKLITNSDLGGERFHRQALKHASNATVRGPCGLQPGKRERVIGVGGGSMKYAGRQRSLGSVISLGPR